MGRLHGLTATCLAVLFAAGCSSDSTGPKGEPAAFLQADGVNGGRLYDQFWAAETDFPAAHPLRTALQNRSDFFRCKQCHGWDRLGTAGAYINRGPRTTRPNISSVNLAAVVTSMSAQQLFEALKRSEGRRHPTVDLSTYHPATNFTVGDQMPDYSQILSDTQLWDLVRFLKVDAFDVRELYDFTTSGSYPTGTITYANIGRNGDAARGDALFTAKCSFCHGGDGRAFKVDGAAFTVGAHLRSKPYEDQHKIRYGQLGSGMRDTELTLAEMRDLYKALANAAKYPD